MLNSVTMVGRIEEINKIENGAILLINIPRNYKNEEGQYESDIIPFHLSGSLSEQTLKYCGVDDLVGVKGRLENSEELIIKAEKVSFLTSRKENK